MVKKKKNGEKNPQQSQQHKQKLLSTKLSTNQKQLRFLPQRWPAEKENEVSHIGILVAEINRLLKNHLGLRRLKDKDSNTHVV